ncbi:MAG: GguC family protein [Burkholderiaceae bacterium]
MRLIQLLDDSGRRRVGAIGNDDGAPRLVIGVDSTRELALHAYRAGQSIAAAIARLGLGEEIDYDTVIERRRLLVPLDHPEPSRCTIAVTGLTHWGSAQSRDTMHAKLQGSDLSDSMKMFKLGVEGGKPAPGTVGTQSEWVWKGNGGWIVPPEHPLEYPAYADDAGDEAEIVGLYVIGDRGEVLRVGFALGNEYSDHVMERKNYLYLSHSKLRCCSIGPEILVGELPADVRGCVRVRRDGRTHWAKEFVSGEDNMVHTVANLEQHHFKYSGFRRPGDVHVYFLGASVLSFADGVKLEPGDVMEVSSPHFGRPLRNPIERSEPTGWIEVRTL